MAEGVVHLLESVEVHEQDRQRRSAPLCLGHRVREQLGVAIENGVRLAINEKGGKLGGREIEWFKVDDESEPSKGIENASKLVQRDKVDVLIGTVHSGVQMGIQKVARDSGMGGRINTIMQVCFFALSGVILLIGALATPAAATAPS